MSLKYPPSFYDENLNLRIGTGLLATVLFLCRPYLVLALSVANRSNKMGLLDLLYADRAALAAAAVAALPALAVLYAMIRRRADAGALPRALWRRGRSLLIASAALNLPIVLMRVVAEFPRIHNLDLLQTLAVLWIGAWLLTSARVRDTFADFPKPVAAATGASADPPGTAARRRRRWP
jgi:hypothetical protein